jgi:hypothetical protein
MSNISATLEKTGTVQNLLNTIDEVLKTEPKALTIFAADGNNFTKPILDPILMSLAVPVSGAIFPKIIFKDELLDKGSIVIAWYNDIAITNYKNIENTDTIKDLVGISSQSQNQKDIGEYLIFIDGAVPKLEDNLDVLYKKIGFRATFAGGGAGSLSSGSIPCIFSNDGLLGNAMQTVATNHKSKVTTTHGWQKQSGPHLVTSSNKSNLKTINYEPAIPFYKKHNALFRDHNLKDTAFSSFFNEYPLGIENLDGELLVREPIRYTEDSIEYIGNIPEYSKIHMLTGTKDSSREEVDKELKSIKLNEEKNTDATFIFSCALRDDADQNGASKEIKMLNKHLASSKHVIGSLAMGEIATGPSRLLHLHNKSIVITRLSGEL